MKLVRIVKDYTSTITSFLVKQIPVDDNGKSKYLIALPNDRANVLINAGYAVESTEEDLVNDNDVGNGDNIQGDFNNVSSKKENDDVGVSNDESIEEDNTLNEAISTGTKVEEEKLEEETDFNVKSKSKTKLK